MTTSIFYCSNLNQHLTFWKRIIAILEIFSRTFTHVSTLLLNLSWSNNFLAAMWRRIFESQQRLRGESEEMYRRKKSKRDFDQKINKLAVYVSCWISPSLLSAPWAAFLALSCSPNIIFFSFTFSLLSRIVSPSRWGVQKQKTVLIVQQDYELCGFEARAQKIKSSKTTLVGWPIVCCRAIWTTRHIGLVLVPVAAQIL